MDYISAISCHFMLIMGHNFRKVYHLRLVMAKTSVTGLQEALVAPLGIRHRKRRRQVLGSSEEESI